MSVRHDRIARGREMLARARRHERRLALQGAGRAVVIGLLMGLAISGAWVVL